MKKYISSILIIIILVGLLSPMAQVHASTALPSEPCVFNNGIATNAPCGQGAGSITQAGTVTGTCPGNPALTTEAACDTQFGNGWVTSLTPLPVQGTQTTGTCPGNPEITNQADCNASFGNGGWVTTAGGTTPNTPSDQSGLYNNLTCLNSSGLNLGGCIEIVFYYLLVTLPSWLLTLAALFFNALIAIGLSSTLFHATFVAQGWAVVRDISNIFFILILLYVAIETILGLSHDAKKTIVKIIVMALLINFSMFFTDIVIDASNILAQVFYNKINVCSQVNGQTTCTTYTQNTIFSDEKDVSGGLVQAFNPSEFISADFFTKAQQQAAMVPASVASSSSAVSAGVSSTISALTNFIPGVALVKGVSAVIGYFSPTNSIPIPLILGIELISGALMLYAAYSFFIVGLAFLSRLIELWILIVFSPFAFMSSSIPALSKVESIGWDEWLSRVLKLSFMAPIFMFFLYLIFMLVQAHLFDGLASASLANQSLLQTVLFVIIPALVVLIILKKAVAKAEKTSGELGSAVVGGVKALAVLGIGAAAGGTALIGRSLVASTTAAASRTEGAVHYGKARIEHNKALEKWEHGGKLGPKPTWQNSLATYRAANPTATINTNNPLTLLGGRINAAQARSGEIDHARHEIDEAKKKAGLREGQPLSGLEAENLQKSFTKNNRSEIESDIKRGYDSKGRDIKDKVGSTIPSQDTYESANRSRIADDVRGRTPAEKAAAIAAGDVDSTTGKTTDQGNKKIENNLRKEFNEKLKGFVDEVGKIRFNKLQEEAKQKVGISTRIAARTTGGTYDVRNLSGLQTDKREGLGTKAAVGIVTAVAMGMRAGLKHGAGVDGGTGSGNTFKDIGQTVTEALKNVKLNVNLGDSGKGESHGPIAAHAPSDHH